MIPETVTPAGLRARAEIQRGILDESCARHLEMAADEIERLRAALTQFVAACDTAPPTSLMTELGMACKVARAALSPSKLFDTGEKKDAGEA